MFSADGPILKIQTHMDKEFDSMKPILSFHNYANHMGKPQNSPMDYTIKYLPIFTLAEVYVSFIDEANIE